MKLKRINQLAGMATAGAMICLTSIAHSAGLTLKPGAPVQSAEAGSAVSRNAHLTLVGSDAMGSHDANFRPSGFSAYNGAIYLMADGSETPIRTYQYQHTQQRLIDELGLNFTPTSNIAPMRMGSRVALTDRWMVATINWYGNMSQTTRPALFVADRDAENGLGPSCPSVNGKIDCFGVITPVALPNPNVTLGRSVNFGLAATDQHIAVLGPSTETYGDAVLQVLSYNESIGQWQPSLVKTFSNAQAPFSIDIAGDYLAFGIGNKSDSNGGRLYYATLRNGQWSEVKSYQHYSTYWAQSVAVNKDGRIAVGGGNDAGGRINFYDIRHNSNNSPYISYRGFFSTPLGVSKVTLEGNQAAAHISNGVGEHQVLTYVNDVRFSSSNSSGYSNWSRYGYLDFERINQLPEFPLDEGSRFFPSDMAMSFGRISWGWRNLDSNTNPQIQLVGGHAYEDFLAMYDPQLDTAGKYLKDLSNGPIVLDEASAVMTENVVEQGLNTPLIGVQNQGWVYKQHESDDYFQLEWNINVPASNWYQVCVRYVNVDSDAQAVVLKFNGNGLSLFDGLTPNGWEFRDQCQTEYLEAGKSAFKVVGWSSSLAIDQITIQ